MTSPAPLAVDSSRTPLLALAGVGFLALFTFDGVLSASDEALRALVGSAALGAPRELVAWSVVTAAPLAALCCALSPRWPARVYLPPILATGWFALGALPLSMAVAPPRLLQLIDAIQLGIAGCAWTLLLLALRRSGGLRAFSAARAVWSPKRLAVFALALVLAGPAIAAAYGTLAAASWIEAATDGFVDVHASGVSIADRRYVRGDREVRLVGMMHIGESETYDVLFDSFQGESTLVLEEGVTDREGLLVDHLSYGKAASALGLSAQGSVSAYVEAARESSGDDADSDLWPDVRHADIDVSALSPSTLVFIERAGRMWGSDDPSTELLAMFRNPPPSAELNLMFWELMEMRNERVIDELERGLESHRLVIVPWGALHLPGIAQAIESDGFVRAQETRRVLVSWSTVLAALLR